MSQKKIGMIAKVKIMSLITYLTTIQSATPKEGRVQKNSAEKPIINHQEKLERARQLLEDFPGLHLLGVIKWLMKFKGGKDQQLRDHLGLKVQREIGVERLTRQGPGLPLKQ